MTTRPATLEHPIYDALIEEQGFDPQSVTPIRTPEERQIDHMLWFDAATARVTRALRPGAYETPKARARKGGAAKPPAQRKASE